MPRLKTLTLSLMILSLSALVFSGGVGWAAGEGKAASEVTFIFQIIVLVLVGRLMGEAMQRIGQPAVTGQLVAGILLGPSVFGALFPEAQLWLFPKTPEQKAMIDAVSQLGILMLLLLTGMETDVRLIRRAGRAAFSVSAAGIIIPFALGFTLGEFLPDAMLPRPDLRIITSLFLGTALSIASVKIVAMVVREMNFMRRNLGQVIVSSAIIDDTIGWIIIAIIFSFAQHGAVDIGAVAKGVLGTLAFMLFSFTIGRKMVFFIIRWTNDNFKSEMPVISAILIIMGGMALITQFIGVHTVLGAFIAGVLIGQSPILTRHIDEQLRGLIIALFAPVFFGLAGLSSDLTILKDPRLFMLTLGLILIASVGKFGGAFIGGKIGGLTRQESFALALGMNARGSTEVIIASIGLSMGALSQDLFTMIVAMAIVTTMAMPPTLRWALARLPMREDEAKRLDREAFAERGFVTNLERLLLTVDDSANGRFTARLGGLLAGAVGMPATVLRLNNFDDPANPEAKPAAVGAAVSPAPVAEKKIDPQSDPAHAALVSAAEKVRPIEAEPDENIKAEVDVTLRQQAAVAEKAVADEAAKGYDLMMVGLDPTTSSPGLFDRNIARVAGSFEGPIAIMRASGPHAARPEQSRLNILVPVTGTAMSRRGAELALTLAHASRARITALYVSDSPDVSQNLDEDRRRLRFRRILASRRSERAILKDMSELADNFDTPMRVMSHTHGAAEQAILHEARKGHYDLIVMGVNRRPGDVVNFGAVASAMLEQEKISVLFLASETYGQEPRPNKKEDIKQ